MSEASGAEVVQLHDDALWGAKAIAGFAGVSVDTVYAWASDPESPVYKPRGRYFAERSAMRMWLRSKPMKTQISPDLTH